MSTDDVSPVPRTAAPREAPPAVTAMVRLISDTWRQAAPYLPEMSKTFYGLLFTLAPDVREMFPVNVEVRRGKLMRAIARVVQMVDRPGDLVPFLTQLGRDYRKYDVESRHYEAIGTAMLAALREQLGPAWTPEVERAWAEGYTIVARSMQEAAASDPSPARLSATVTDHRRLSWDLAMVRVEPEARLPYRAGQYVSIEIPQRPRLWRYYSPANAPRPDGLRGFHVRWVAGAGVGRAIASHPQPGDALQLAPLHVVRRAGPQRQVLRGPHRRVGRQVPPPLRQEIVGGRSRRGHRGRAPVQPQRGRVQRRHPVAIVLRGAPPDEVDIQHSDIV